jgi:hypothetical protein
MTALCDDEDWFSSALFNPSISLGEPPILLIWELVVSKALTDWFIMLEELKTFKKLGLLSITLYEDLFYYELAVVAVTI